MRDDAASCGQCSQRFALACRPTAVGLSTLRPHPGQAHTLLTVRSVWPSAKPQDCPNTVRLLGCFESEEEVQLVTELCTGGDLQKLSDVSAPSPFA
jgi:hypothetical protein